MEGKHKSLLVINESTDADVTLNLYLSDDIVCWLPHTSKVIKPKNRLFHTSKWGCKLKLVARFKEQKLPKKVLLIPQQWVGKKLIRITESLKVEEDDLANHPEEEKKCLREKNRDEELDSVDGQRNLYSILRLDMKEVRAMSKDEQDEEIKSAFHRELQIWHRDDGDDDIVREVIMAYDILQDREKRARYNNMADYDKGWLSVKRFKAVFWPECETVAQRLAWMKRIGLLALSVGLTVGGLLSVVLTAGFSSPLLVTAIAGGINSLRETVSKEAVLDGCDVKKWLMSTGVGYVLAFLPGGGAIAVALLQTTAITVSELMGIRIAIAAGCGTVSSLGSDAKKKFIDGEKVTFKQAMGHAACQGVAAAAATFAGGAVAKAMRLGTQSSAAAAANVEGAIGEIGEQLSPSPLHDQAHSLAQRIPVPLTEKATKIVIEKAGELTEKQLDDPMEDLPSSAKYDADLQQCTKEDVDALVNALDTNKPIDGIVKYISKGIWYSGLSKMVVSYSLNGEIITKEVRGNGKQITIPSNATKIEVRFEIWRPPWGNIFKYDRFQNFWCEPYEMHVFRYESPTIRTFTIDGFLWREAVMRVTDEHNDETNEI